MEATFHTLFAATGETVTETLELAFRTRTTIERQLHAAGFDVGATYGGWGRRPLAEKSPIMIFTARVRRTEG